MKKSTLLITLFLSLFTCTMIFQSCVSKREYIYFQKTVRNDSMPEAGSLIKYTQPTLKSNDLISIAVSAVDPKVVEPFNLSTTSNDLSDGRSVSAPTYLIDADGMIDFPVLGNMNIAGLTRVQATQLIRDRLKSYVTNPIVNIRMLNFKITVLGEVKNPGVYTIQNERITLPEAIGLAGDLNLTGIRNNVLVVREVEGQRIETRVNMASDSVFNSPVYYLNQNDLIYVEPNKVALTYNNQTRSYLALGLSATTLIINIINLVRK